MVLRILTVAVKSELDVLVSRQRARQVTALCGFNAHDQVRIATVVSELARNIYNYANSGKIEFAVSKATTAQDLVIRVEDEGPGIDNLDAILEGRYQSKTGMGLGIIGARRLMDHVDITTAKNVGTTLLLKRALPADAPILTATMVGSLGAQLGTLQDNVALAEVRHQNLELLDAMAALKLQQEELQAVTQQLRATNDTVVALNAELQEKAAELQKADVRKDEFLAILAHELRNPLAATGLAASVLEATPVSAERAAQLGQIVSRQIGHMSRLVEDLLDVSRVTRGLVAIDKQAVDMRTITKTAVEQLGPAIKAKSHQLVLSLPDEVCLVSGDATRLIQVGTNLIGNAARYTPDGGQISVALLTADDTVTFQVMDNGQGIDPDLLPRLFDLYVQAERSSEGRIGGLGIGLTLVKSIVELHGGTVTAMSNGKGLGSTFAVTYPRLNT
ncbi:sensor histidine kinase [Noviherbaspirillum sp. CPCC 100848]|uniref:histidine kinase n=1 Tax=Noviherbaspirillum album TaxID=3080276 RepID=A0ABU6JGT5_9BURK|nr:sensor histidine kinase [Noviherbaspirillum sp. CPCC 100848]MEC4722691.1 sensor histidine kinase [Noviherbaspirillum sp. CPCC 100848]